MDEFTFYNNMDSIGYDLYKSNVTDINILKNICKYNEKCVGFNTLGYLKYYINDTMKSFPDTNIGLYVYDKRLNEIRMKKNTSINGYIFYPNCDSYGYDLCHKPKLSITEMKELADSDKECIAFNTLGYFKSDIILKKYFKPLLIPLRHEGLYVKKIELNDKTRIKCINLERRQDRKEVMTELLKNTELIQYCDFYKAVDGKNLEKTDELEKLFKNNNFGSRKTVIGCALSHYNLWKKLSNDKIYDNYIIIEDDIKFSCNNPCFEITKIFKLLEKNYSDYDIVYLGYSMNKNYMEPYEKIYGETDKLILIPHLINISIGGTFGYIISKKGANKLLEIINKYGIRYVIDNMAYKYQKEMNIIQYETVPRLILSEYVANDNFGKVDSDIHYNNEKLF